ncbi:response regulator [Azohydromonas lata]|uniref:histidine kinase n=1 Tax=Azohydromonas lata TaxID=45677 RepID=A0ABU5IBI4_9BURK|nr:response regulator [Azohydromonas lata]MDZ5456454.1 response regulator [Azohydromonas lata]
MSAPGAEVSPRAQSTPEPAGQPLSAPGIGLDALPTLEPVGVPLPVLQETMPLALLDEPVELADLAPDWGPPLDELPELVDLAQPLTLNQPVMGAPIELASLLKHRDAQSAAPARAPAETSSRAVALARLKGREVVPFLPIGKQAGEAAAAPLANRAPQGWPVPAQSAAKRVETQPADPLPPVGQAVAAAQAQEIQEAQEAQVSALVPDLTEAPVKSEEGASAAATAAQAPALDVSAPQPAHDALDLEDWSEPPPAAAESGPALEAPPVATEVLPPAGDAAAIDLDVEDAPAAPSGDEPAGEDAAVAALLADDLAAEPWPTAAASVPADEPPADGAPFESPLAEAAQAQAAPQDGALSAPQPAVDDGLSFDLSFDLPPNHPLAGPSEQADTPFELSFDLDDAVPPAMAAQASPDQPLAGADPDFDLNFDAGLAVPAPAPASAPAPAPAPVSDFNFDLDVPAAPVAPPHRPLAPAPMAAVAGALAPLDGEDCLIGPLRVPHALFDVYVDEAQALCGRLLQRLGAWAPPQALERELVVVTQALAGMADTVGDQALAELARALGDAMAPCRLEGCGTAAMAQVLVEGALCLRRMLEQFAAGELPSPAPAELLRGLRTLHEVASAPSHNPFGPPPPMRDRSLPVALTDESAVPADELDGAAGLSDWPQAAPKPAASLDDDASTEAAPLLDLADAAEPAEAAGSIADPALDALDWPEAEPQPAASLEDASAEAAPLLDLADAAEPAEADGSIADPALDALDWTEVEQPPTASLEDASAEVAPLLDLADAAEPAEAAGSLADTAVDALDWPEAAPQPAASLEDASAEAAPLLDLADAAEPAEVAGSIADPALDALAWPEAAPQPAASLEDASAEAAPLLDLADAAEPAEVAGSIADPALDALAWPEAAPQPTASLEDASAEAAPSLDLADAAEPAEADEAIADPAFDAQVDALVWSEDETPAAVPAGESAAADGGAEDTPWEVGEDDLQALDMALFPVFEEEALELLPQLSQALQAWAQDCGGEEHAAAGMRALHTLKGGARLAGAMRLGDAAHALECALEDLVSSSGLPERSRIEAMQGRAGVLGAAFERLRAACAQPPRDEAADVPVPPPAPDLAEMDSAGMSDWVDLGDLGDLGEAGDSAGSAGLGDVPALDRAVPDQADGAPAPQLSAHTQPPQPRIDWSRFAAQPPAPPPPAASAAPAAPVSLRAAALDRLVSQAGEVGITRARLGAQVRQLGASLVDLDENLARLRSQLREVESQADAPAGLSEQDSRTRLQELARMMAESLDDLSTVQHGLRQGLRGTEDELVGLGRAAAELQDDLLDARRQPFSTLAGRLRDAVAQAAHAAQRQARLDIEGGEAEMDRGVLERIAPVLEQWLRHAASQGVAPPAENRVRLKLAREGSQVTVECDSGGLAPPPQALRAEVETLGGHVAMDDAPAQGSRFTLHLPLSTAVMPVLLLRCGEATVAVPAAQVEEVRQLAVPEAQQAAQAGRLGDGPDAPVFHALETLLLQPPAPPASDDQQATVLLLRAAQDGETLALQVREIVGRQDALLQPLGPQLSTLPGLAGMALLPTGLPLPVYQPAVLAQRHAAQAAGAGPSPVAPAPLWDGGTGAAGLAAAAPLVLVVDDSLTVRRATQRLLQREGYRVALAKDGLQALQQLQQEAPALVLTDLEMPHMDGFELLARLREDARWAALPVIVITSRLAARHRERAAGLGARHYLGKPYAQDEMLTLVARYSVRPSLPH